MISAELYKLRTQRTPMVCAALLLVGVLASPAVLLFYTPADPAAYSVAFTTTFQLLAPLVAIVFGGWLLGTEYRQGTVKRLLTGEPRRMRAFATKASVGAAALITATGIAGVIGWTASWAVGSLNDQTVAWNGRELLAAGLVALAAGAVAYGLSAITRSDSFAMVGTVALVLVLDPLLSLIPKVGKYSFGTALDTLTNEVANTADLFGPAALSLGTAGITLTLWLVAFVGSGSYLFARRDV
ncbi:MAG: ABC transporter permease subunit [Actinomycetia bacterium]|nr:ABC transporter permease subunit [Actinomycetes bacterium]